MGWRDWFVRSFSPGHLSGVAFGDWLRVLCDNRFRLPPSSWPRAICTTLLSLRNTPLRWLESALYGRRVAAQQVLPPLFVLGHTRSGTTHLQRLLAVDNRFACATYSQSLHPHDFLITDPVRAKIYRWFRGPATRGVDNMAQDAGVPAEEEFFLCRMTLLSPILSQVFPRRAEHYDRYLTFRGVPAKEVERWKAAFLRLARKLTWKYRRPLLFKSPANTARVKLLLEVFPDARFVHVHRNPYVVYQSSMRLRLMLSALFSFQRLDPAKLHARLVRQYAAMYEAFFEERKLVPAGRLCEVSFEDLEKDPIGQVHRVYDELGLPDFEIARPALESYVASLAGYKKTPHPDLPPEVRAEIARAWRRCFDEWHYPL
jgi:hypothetical protein